VFEVDLAEAGVSGVADAGDGDGLADDALDPGPGAVQPFRVRFESFPGSAATQSLRAGSGTPVPLLERLSSAQSVQSSSVAV
jgi:hypothetical protein